MNELILILYTTLLALGAAVCLAFGAEALVAFAAVQTLLMNLFVTKQIALAGFSATAADALAIGSTLSLNLIQEYISRDLAQKAIWICFITSVFASLSSWLHLLYVPIATDCSQLHFEALLTPVPRIVAASFISYIISQHLEWRLYGYFKEKFKGKHFVIRNWTSVAISQALDTVLFSVLGLWGNVESLIDIILISYLIKIIILITSGPILGLIRKFSLRLTFKSSKT